MTNILKEENINEDYVEKFFDKKVINKKRL